MTEHIIPHTTAEIPPPDPDITGSIGAEAFNAFTMVQSLSDRLTTKWGLYQIAIIIILAALAFILSRLLRHSLRAFFGRKSGVAKPILRIYVFIKRRVAPLIFIMTGWLLYYAMQTFSWPSRSYFIGIIVALVSAWILIDFITTLIKNRSIRKLVAWSGWIYATLYLTGATRSAGKILDAIAIDTGTMHLSLLTILIAIFTLSGMFILASFLYRYGAHYIQTAQDMSPAIKALLTKALQLVLFVCASLFGLSAIGFDLTNLAVLSGAIGLGIGFGLQKIVSNLISGIIILMDKSIKPGDVISLDGTFGWITQLGARYASITTRDGREYLVPNEDFITNQVINWSHSSDFVRVDIDFGVAYQSDPHLVRKVAIEAPLSVDRVLKTPRPVCHIIDFADSAIQFKLRFWIKDPTSGLTNIRGNVYLKLWDILKENNIEIPYPRRDVHMYPAGDAPLFDKTP